MPRRFVVLLAVSLFLNIFAAGALGGGLFMLRREGGLHARLATAQRPINAAGAALPAPERGQFDRTIQAAIRNGRELNRIARDNRIAAAELFVQPRFDQAAVATALDRARAADFELRARLEAAAIAFAATLPTGDRAILAQGLARGGPLRHPERARAAHP